MGPWGMSGVSPIRSVGDRVLARLARIGADPQDDDDTRASKALLVLISVLILPVALLWAALYLAFGSPVGWVPLAYFAILLAAIVVFSRTRDFGKFLRVGQVAILLAPTLSMVPLGGFLDSGGVGLWGILAPLAALVFSDLRTAGRWYVAYLVVFLGSGIAGELMGGGSPAVPEWFTSTMLGLNVTVGGTIVFTLLAVFARQRRNALAALREEQARAEGLLLNILPRSIADRLKADPRRIADQFSSASILFADVVDFTPLAERLPPAEVVGVLDHLFSHFDELAERYGLEKIKTIGDCYMGRRGRPLTAARPCPRACPDGARHAGSDALARRGRAPRARAARGDQLRTGRGRRDRPQAVPVRPLGRCREHGESHGVPRDLGADPDHPSDEGAARGRVRLRAEGDNPAQGERRNGGLVPRRSPSESRHRTPCPSGAGPAARGGTGRLSVRRSQSRFGIG